MERFPATLQWTAYTRRALKSALRADLREQALAKLRAAVTALSNEFSKGGKSLSVTKPTEDRPIPVVVTETSASAWSLLSAVLNPAINVLITAGIVLVFVVFMLIGEDLRNRLIRLMGLRQMSVTTKVFDDAAERVSRYLLMQLIVNVSYGIVLAAGLSLLQLPNAILWGLLAALLRYIPYVGPWIAAAFPIVLSLAVLKAGGTR